MNPIKKMLAKLGAAAAAFYIILSLLFFCSFYISVIDIDKKNESVASGFAWPWMICSSSVAVMIILSSQMTAVLQPTVMASGFTLVISCMICCCTSCISRFT
jgi:hypothetical protein